MSTIVSTGRAARRQRAAIQTRCACLLRRAQAHVRRRRRGSSLGGSFARSPGRGSCLPHPYASDPLNSLMPPDHTHWFRHLDQSGPRRVRARIAGARDISRLRRSQPAARHGGGYRR